MEFTGERVIPGQVDPDLWAEHISRYALAATLQSAASKVLDIGCGAGYGTARLAPNASLAVGIDIAPDAAASAQSDYGASNTRFLAASATALPFTNHTFDLITAYEVIEHITDWDLLLKEAARVLKPNGIFLVSTPNKPYYTESRGTAGANPFHVHEFEHTEFKAALETYFSFSQLLLQNRTEGFAFYSDHNPPATAAAQFESIQPDPDSANFFIGLCSHSPLPQTTNLVFVPRAGNLLRERERHVTAVNLEIAETRQQFQALHAAHDEQNRYLHQQNEWAKGLDRDLTAAREVVSGLQSNLEERTDWALKLDADLQTARARVTELQTLFEERTAWALKTNDELVKTTADLAHLRNQFQTVLASRWLKLGRKFGLGPVIDPNVGQGD